MFTVIYKFQVKESLTQQFEENWTELTKLIYQHQGSLGSRLHKSDELNYIAYAQWPDRETWESEWNDMPEHSKEISRKMKEACETRETIFELEVVEDLLKK
jgi:heme-degrading monooxygenase HmoA